MRRNFLWHFFFVLPFSTAFAQSTQLLPDLVTSRIHLFDHKIDTTTIPGAKLLRFANATPNFGRGRLELRGGEVNPEGSQNVYQRIFRSNGTSTLRLAGTLDHHPEHDHTHFNEYASYRLRKVAALGGVGSVVARSSKVSFCVRDSLPANPRLPGFSPLPRYRSCSTGTQGISVGWMDVCGKDLFGQWIDISQVPRGRYWLESVVDPSNRIKESNETNNAARIMLFLD